jgi:hypothetical protein
VFLHSAGLVTRALSHWTSAAGASNAQQTLLGHLGSGFCLILTCQSPCGCIEGVGSPDQATSHGLDRLCEWFVYMKLRGCACLLQTSVQQGTFGPLFDPGSIKPAAADGQMGRLAGLGHLFGYFTEDCLHRMLAAFRTVTLVLWRNCTVSAVVELDSGYPVSRTCSGTADLQR